MAKKKDRVAEVTASTDMPAENTFRTSVAEALVSMIYISESEAPLDLQVWPEVTDVPSLQAQITAQFGIPADAQTVVSSDDFLASIQQMADPSDAVMVDYASHYGKLFTLLKTGATELTVVRASGEQLHLFIAAFGESGPVIIHTTAIET